MPDNRWLIFEDGKPIMPIGETYEADPFYLDYLFFELYDYKKGVIAIKKDGKNEVVLEQPYHLSFPSVFADNGEYYMTPETVNNYQLELYRAKNFPYDWELVKVIARGWFDDPIIYKADRYYCFTSENDNLMVFAADDLLGDWSLVHTNKGQYRSAGHIFERAGKVVRPCQDCTNRYGEGLVFYELDGFTHKEISRFKLGQPFTGCHTYNGRFIDGRIPYETPVDSIRQSRDIRRFTPTPA